MAGVPGRHPGGIAGLVAFLRLYGAAVEADLAHFYPGTRLSDLASGDLTWRRLKVLVDGLPRDSELSRQVNGEAADWSTADHLLAITVDALQIANWQRSKDGTTGRNRPSPIPRPGLIRPSGERVGKTTRTPEEVKAYLAQFRPAAEEATDGG